MATPSPMTSMPMPIVMNGRLGWRKVRIEPHSSPIVPKTTRNPAVIAPETLSARPMAVAVDAWAPSSPSSRPR